MRVHSFEQVGSASVKIKLWAGLLFSTALTILVALPFYDEPLTENEGAFVYLLQEWLSGSIPYVAFPENKPPLGFLIYGFFGFGAPSEFQVRLGLAVLTALSVMGIGIFAAKHSADAGIAAAAVFASSWCWPAINAWVGNAETLMHLPQILTALFLWMFLQTGRTPHLMMAGFFLGFASLIKQTAVVHLIWIIWVLYRSRGGWTGQWISHLKMFLIAFLGLHILFALGFAYFGDLVAYLEALSGQNFSYYLHNISTGVTWDLFLYWLKEGPERFSDPALCWVVAILGMRRANHTSREIFRFGWAWLIGSFIVCLCGGIGRDYYFTPILAPTALLFGLGVSELIHHEPSRRTAWTGFALAATAMGISISGSMVYLNKPVGASFSKYSTHEHYSKAKAIGLYIRSRTRPGDRIFSSVASPQILVYAERRSAIPHVWPGTYIRDRAHVKEVAEILCASPPAYLVVDYADYPEKTLPGLADLIRDSYVYDGSSLTPSLKVDLWARNDNKNVEKHNQLLNSIGRFENPFIVERNN